MGWFWPSLHLPWCSLCEAWSAQVSSFLRRPFPPTAQRTLQNMRDRNLGPWQTTVETRLEDLEKKRRKGPTFTTPTRPPTEGEERNVRVEYRLRGERAGTVLGETDTDDLRFRAGPFNVRVVWDQFHDDMVPAATLFLSNSFRGMGVVRWESLTVTIDGDRYDMGRRGCMVPKGCIIRSQIEPEDWGYFDEEEDLPRWIKIRALGEIETRTANWVGPYRFWRNDKTSYESGGDGVAPYHGGSKDWLAVCAEGRAYRWAEACGSMSRAIWMLADDGTPLNLADTGERYWDPSSVELAPTGYKWTPEMNGWCSFETTLAQRPSSDVAHSRRWYGAVYALAGVCKAARVMADVCWNEIKNKYSMDQRVFATNDPNAVLFSPLHQILDLIGPGGPQEPPEGGNWGNRTEAHAINIVAEHMDYMSNSDRKTYTSAWFSFLARKVDRYGRADFSYTGDAASSSGLQAPVAMHFQQALLCEAARNLDMDSIGDRIAAWWTAKPPYYAHQKGNYRTARDAPNKGSAVADYTMFTHPGTWAGYGSFAGVVNAAKQSGLGETALSCVPPEDRDWESVS